MKSLRNKKGFTIVELVIVIAVIAILAAVLIPTFSGIVDKANKSAAEQGARNKYTELYAKDMSDGKLDEKEGETALTKSGSEAKATWTYAVANGVATVTYTTNGYEATFNGTAMTTTEKSN